MCRQALTHIRTPGHPPPRAAHLLQLLLLHDARLLGSDDSTYGATPACEPGPPAPSSAALSPPPPRSSPPFLGPRLRSAAAAALLLGFCAWNLRCPCAMAHHKPEEAGPRHESRKSHDVSGGSGTQGGALRGAAVQKIRRRISLPFTGAGHLCIIKHGGLCFLYKKVQN